MSRSRSPSSDGPDTDTHSTFVGLAPCNCTNPDDKYTYEVLLRHHRMWNCDWLPDGISHDAVLIRWQCNNCRRRMRETFDFVPQGKRRRWGYYDRRISSGQRRRVNLAWADVYNIYEGMFRDGYILIGRNCKDWAKEFIAKILRKDRINVDRCGCNPNENYWATNIEVYNNSGDWVVTLHLLCSNCQTQQRMRLSFFFGERGKFCIWGHHVLRAAAQRYNALSRPLSQIMQIYGQMQDAEHYHFTTLNSAIWARNFYGNVFGSW